MADFCCPMCAAELSIEALFSHAEMREAFAQLVRWSVPAGARVMAYITLFAPAKNRQTLARKAKLLDELLPDLHAGSINRKGRDWAAPPEVWSAAIDQMLLARDSGRLKLPLTGHGYLHEVIVAIAEKAEAVAEQQAEAERRNSPTKPATFEVRGQPMSMGAALDQVYGDGAKRGNPPAPKTESHFVRKAKAEIAAKLKNSEGSNHA